MKKLLFGLGTVAAVVAPVVSVVACGGGSGTKDLVNAKNGDGSGTNDLVNAGDGSGTNDLVNAGDGSGTNDLVNATNVYSDKAVSLNLLMGLAYKIEINNSKTETAEKYDVKYDVNDSHSEYLIKQIDTLDKHTVQQHGPASTDITTTFGQANLEAIYKLVEAIYGTGEHPTYAKIDVVGKAIETFNAANFMLPTVDQLNTLASRFTTIRKYVEVFNGWTNRQLKLEIVARNGDKYQVAKTEAEAKALNQNLKLATWPTHMGNTVAIYDGEFIVRVVQTNGTSQQ